MMHEKSGDSVPGKLNRLIKARSRQWIILACVASILLSGSELLAARRNEVSHVVFISLKRPGNLPDQQLLVRATKRFRKIRGVIRVDAGIGMPVTRAGVEQSFDVGMVIVFRDRAALEDYERNPRHLAAMREVLQPLAKRYVIYNFSRD